MKYKRLAVTPQQAEEIKSNASDLGITMIQYIDLLLSCDSEPQNEEVSFAALTDEEIEMIRGAEGRTTITVNAKTGAYLDCLVSFNRMGGTKTGIVHNLIKDKLISFTKE